MGQVITPKKVESEVIRIYVGLRDGAEQPPSRRQQSGPERASQHERHDDDQYSPDVSTIERDSTTDRPLRVGDLRLGRRG